MGRVFRRESNKKLPPDAIIAKNSKGVTIATWVARRKKFTCEVLPCGTMYRWKATHWSIEYVPHGRSEPIREATHCTDKAWAERVLREVEMREEAKRLGLLDASHDRRQEARAKPIALHIDDYLQDLRNNTRTPQHIRDVGTKLRRVFAKSDVRTLDQITLTTIRSAIATIVEHQKLSEQTRNHYIAKIRGFVRWLVDDDRLPNNPLKKLKQLPVLKRVRERRLMSTLELNYLVRAAQDRTRSNQKVCGEDRVRFYYIMAFTGYRIKEVRHLTPADFSWDGDELAVSLSARKTKNRKRDRHVIPAAFASWFQEWLATKPKLEPLFNLPSKPMKSLRRDLKAGRALWISEAENEDERQSREASDFLAYQDSDSFYLDHHAFRHTYCDEVGRLAPSPQALLGLQRHCDTRMAARYWRTNDREQASVQHELGRRLPAPPSPREKADGTSTPSASQCTVQCAPDGSAPVPPSPIESTRIDRIAGETLSSPENTADLQHRGRGFPNHGPFSFFTRNTSILLVFAWPASAGWCEPGPPGLAPARTTRLCARLAQIRTVLIPVAKSATVCFWCTPCEA
jgi:integrase